MPLAVKELREIKTYVLRELPLVLEQDPQFVLLLEGIISEKFPRRDEFARLLDEFTSFRKESRENFSTLHQRTGRVEEEVTSLNQRTGRVEEELASLNQRTGRVEEEFTSFKVDEFIPFRKETQENFQKVDQRFERIEGDLSSFKEETRENFKKVDQRFEQVDQRFEQVDQRFEQVDQRFERVDQRFDRVEQTLTDLTEEVRNLRDWVEVIAGGLQHRAGRNLEKVVAGALRLGLQRPDIEAEHIKLRQKIYDPQGLVFKAGKQKEVDIVVKNGELLVLEVKSAPKEDDVDYFADKVELVRLQNPDKQVKGVFVALGSENYIRQRCKQHGLILIP